MSKTETAAVLARLETIEALLARRAEAEARAIPSHPMSLADVARICAKDERTVRRWIEKGDLKAKKIGREYLITPANLNRFLEPAEALV